MLVLGGTSQPPAKTSGSSKFMTVLKTFFGSRLNSVIHSVANSLSFVGVLFSILLQKWRKFNLSERNLKFQEC